MVRADYCGDGAPHTVNGVRLEVGGVDEESWDDGAPLRDDFEAIWHAGGPVCIDAEMVSQLYQTGRRSGGYQGGTVWCPGDPTRAVWNPATGTFVVPPRTLPSCAAGGYSTPAGHNLWSFVALAVTAARGQKRPRSS
jgi:hypothetical protein